MTWDVREKFFVRNKFDQGSQVHIHIDDYTERLLYYIVVL
jgi:hypothetical protein